MTAVEVSFTVSAGTTTAFLSSEGSALTDATLSSEIVQITFFLESSGLETIASSVLESPPAVSVRSFSSSFIGTETVTESVALRLPSDAVIVVVPSVSPAVIVAVSPFASTFAIAEFPVVHFTSPAFEAGVTSALTTILSPFIRLRFLNSSGIEILFCTGFDVTVIVTSSDIAPFTTA